MNPMNNRNIQLQYCDASGKFKPYLIDWVSPAELAIFCFQMAQFDWDGSAVDDLLESECNAVSPEGTRLFQIWATTSQTDLRYQEIESFNLVLRQMRRNFWHIEEGHILNKP